MDQRVQGLGNACQARRHMDAGSTSASLFGAALDLPAPAFRKKCQAEKWGLPVGGNYMELLLFADNCWLIAMSPAELRCMARAWNELLVSADCEMRGKRLCGARQPLTVWWQGFKTLGAWTTFDGHFVKEVAEREVIA